MNRYCVTKPTYVVQADVVERAAVDLTGFEGTATEGAGGAEDAAETRTGGDEEKDTTLKSRKPASRVWQFFQSQVPQLEGPARMYQMQAMRPGAHNTKSKTFKVTIRFEVPVLRMYWDQQFVDPG